METFDENGEKVAFNQVVEFFVGAGNFGGRKTSNEVVPVVNAPNRSPDAVMQEKTAIDQVRLYKLFNKLREKETDNMR